MDQDIDTKLKALSSDIEEQEAYLEVATIQLDEAQKWYDRIQSELWQARREYNDYLHELQSIPF